MPTANTTAAPLPGPLHRGLWLGFSLVSLVPHVACLTRYGWFRDEFYYVACARRDLGIFVGRRLRMSPRESWPRVKHYD